MNVLQNCGELVQAYKERIKCENLGSVSELSNGLGEDPPTASTSTKKDSSNGVMNASKRNSTEVSFRLLLASCAV